MSKKNKIDDLEDINLDEIDVPIENIIETELSEIKCPKCGATNIEVAKKCHKCGHPFRETKSCPKCAKRNDIDAKRCVSCGFNFAKKGLPMWVNLILSLILMGVLFLCLHLDKIGVVKRVGLGFKIIAGLLVAGGLYATFTYGKKDILKLDAEEQMNKDNIALKRMKAIATIAVIIGCLFLGAFIIFKFVLNK